MRHVSASCVALDQIRGERRASLLSGSNVDHEAPSPTSLLKIQSQRDEPKDDCSDCQQNIDRFGTLRSPWSCTHDPALSVDAKWRVHHLPSAATEDAALMRAIGRRRDSSIVFVSHDAPLVVWTV